MSTSVKSALATTLHFDENNLWVEFVDGRLLAVPLAYFPALREATAEQRSRFVISGGGSGLHWEELDEDILVENLLVDFRPNGKKGRSLSKGMATQQINN